MAGTLAQRPLAGRVEQVALGGRVSSGAVGHRLGLIGRELAVAYRVLRIGQLTQPLRASEVFLRVAGGLPRLLGQPLGRRPLAALAEERGVVDPPGQQQPQPRRGLLDCRQQLDGLGGLVDGERVRIERARHSGEVQEQMVVGADTVEAPWPFPTRVNPQMLVED